MNKKDLLQACFLHVQQKKESVEKRLAAIVESLQQATKSSAGDKHETGRAMLQLDRENLGKQLAEIEKTQAVLKRIDLSGDSAHIRHGSVVITDAGNYFLSASVGAIEMKGDTYYCISVQSPMGKALLGQQEGNSVSCNGRNVLIRQLL
ncbi:GreA/GreB family elongation factor [Altibacter sp. HG106]|uniref:GreA/GreB family elongation factor n=1 Tax=Altibacter sp. HG106 TaxID=3023937 RepID=UPI0023504A18|nr:GreA/GreB family elongation factor [Altibacter sp. HG106]MDC7994942.1 3-oxoacyl-ACP synthase [Altibacter sp. HG106]